MAESELDREIAKHRQGLLGVDPHVQEFIAKMRRVAKWPVIYYEDAAKRSTKKRRLSSDILYHYDGPIIGYGWYAPAVREPPLVTPEDPQDPYGPCDTRVTGLAVLDSGRVYVCIAGNRELMVLKNRTFSGNLVEVLAAGVVERIMPQPPQTKHSQRLAMQKYERERRRRERQREQELKRWNKAR